jgi:hypothetical protein
LTTPLFSPVCRPDAKDALAALVREKLISSTRPRCGLSATQPPGGEYFPVGFCRAGAQAGGLCDHSTLVSWLYTSVRHAALKSLRAERRRVRHSPARAAALRHDLDFVSRFDRNVLDRPDLPTIT